MCGKLHPKDGRRAEWSHDGVLLHRESTIQALIRLSFISLQMPSQSYQQSQVLFLSLFED